MLKKSFVFYKLKLKFQTFIKQKKKLSSVSDDLEEYVDFSWQFTTRQPTEHESLTLALATLPDHDVMEAWLARYDMNPCDQSQCVSSTCDLHEDDEDGQYACVEAQLSIIESY